MQRLECSQTDMESNLRDLDSPRADLDQDLGGEMQTCRGSSHAAPGFRPGIDSLVTFAVFAAVFTSDIGWQGHVAHLVHRRKEIGHWGEAENTLAEIAARDNLSLQIMLFAEADLLAYANLPSRPYERLPLKRRQLPR